MGYPERKATSHLRALEPDRLRNYSFFQLIELLAKAHVFDLEKMNSQAFDQSLYCFKTNGGLGFPASEIESIRLDDRLELLPRYEIEVNFLGLHGASSPLPGFILEDVANEYAHKNGIKHQFFDFFNHRLNVYLHQIWRKYRYYIQFKVDAQDQFSRKVFSFVGLGDPTFRQQARLTAEADQVTGDVKKGKDEAPVNWGKLLSFSGLIASRSRSPSIVASIIAYYFNLQQVQILEWQPRLVDIAKGQQNALGMRNSALGDNFVVGNKVLTRSSKFVVVIGGLSSDTFHSFLPTGKSWPVLRTLIAFLVREQMAYDVRLGLKQEEISPFQISKDNKLFLGWNTFIGSNPLLTESMVSIRGLE